MNGNNLSKEFLYQALALIVSIILVHATYVSLIRPEAKEIIKEQQIMIEQDINYVNSAQYRINNTKKIEHVELIQMPQKEKVKRIPFGSLIEKGLIIPGEILTDLRKRWTAKVRADGSLISRDNKGSIHSVGAALQGLPACNGWTFWHINRSGRLIPIDHLRNTIKLTA